MTHPGVVRDQRKVLPTPAPIHTQHTNQQKGRRLTGHSSPIDGPMQHSPLFQVYSPVLVPLLVKASILVHLVLVGRPPDPRGGVPHHTLDLLYIAHTQWGE